MTLHENNFKMNNIESKHGDFDGEMDEIPEIDLSIRVRPYMYEPLKDGGSQDNHYSDSESEEESEEDPDGPGQLEELTPQGQEFVYIAIDKDLQSVVIHGSAKGQLYLKRDNTIIRNFLQFCYNPDECQQTILHNNDKGKKVKVRLSQTSTNTSRKPRGRPRKSPLYNTDVSANPSEEEFDVNYTSTVVNQAQPTSSAQMYIGKNAIKPSIATKDHSLALIPEKTESGEDMAQNTTVEIKKEFRDLGTLLPNTSLKYTVTGSEGIQDIAHTGQAIDLKYKFDFDGVGMRLLDKTLNQNHSVESSENLQNDSEHYLKERVPKGSENGIFQCTICFQDFTSALGFKLHKRIHLPGYDRKRKKKKTWDEKFKCFECDKVFASEGHLKRHLKLNPHEPVKCDSCNITLANREKYKSHMNNCHLKKGMNYQCEDCGKVFMQKRILVKHRDVIHKNIHAFSCTICDIQFKYRKSYKAHNRIFHSAGEVPKVVCDICGRLFTTNQNLTRHMKIHNDDLKFACPHCPKTFVQKHGLTRHLRTHTGDKPYSCDICNESFAHNVSLKNHKRKCHEMNS